MSSIDIDLNSQSAALLDDDGNLVRRYAISSSRHGAGERNGSFCTPRGRHVIRARIGAGQPLNSVFVKRRPTGEIYDADLAAQYPDRDWILTRILWLSGCEVGYNRLGDVDTMRRYIYIHGTPDSVVLGKPVSIGCIRMHNNDLLDLFERVRVGDRVYLHE
jgi:lipoprotein-anchoring transpeptidase ErfK/SrfK